MTSAAESGSRQFEYHADDPAATRRLAMAFAAAVPGGSVVALDGPLGAGKTFFVRALVEAWGVPTDDVNSPTFVLVNEYQGNRRIFHVDAYRVRDEDEFLELGPDEWFESDAITLVEWAERVAGSLPEERIGVGIEVTGETSRRFRICARGERLGAVVDRLREGLPEHRAG